MKNIINVDMDRLLCIYVLFLVLFFMFFACVGSQSPDIFHKKSYVSETGRETGGGITEDMIPEAKWDVSVPVMDISI